MLLRRSSGILAAYLAIPILAAFLCPSVHGADKEKKKDEKKVKQEPWVEVRTAHFVVASDGGEKTARRIADQFERLCGVIQSTMPNSRVSLGIPIQIMAARNGQSFAELFPEFPYDNNNRRPQPPGLYISGPERTFIGIRANASGPTPYSELFQEYGRQVLKLSYQSLPPWLEEGYSNVYGSVSFTDHGPRISHPDPEDLSVLFESPLLPLDLIFRVDRNSPYYSVGEKTTVYFAESRALIHFLLTDPQIAGSKALDEYVARVERGADSLETARQVFGDLNQLQSNFNSYIQQTKVPPSDIASPGGGDSGGASRTLSPAEAEARMGALSASRGRYGDANDKLEEALKLDPSLADAEQTMGFLALHDKELDDAEKHFSRALELEPNNALTYYGQGLLAMNRAGFVGVPVAAIMAFEKTVSLNPDFAPAWDYLASIYAERPETMKNALSAEQKAVALAPGERAYQTRLSVITERASRTERPGEGAAGIQIPAGIAKTVDKTGNTTSSRSAQPQVSTPSVSANGAPVGTSSSSGTLRIENKTEVASRQSPASPPAAKTEPSSSPAPMAASELLVYSMVGTITDVNCANAPQVQITLKAQTIVMHLHATDFGNVSVKAAGSNSPAKKAACAALRGRNARVSYLLVSGQTWDGEMQVIEFR